MGRRCRSSTSPATSGSCGRWSPGATGIDLFLLVVDAAEGARPQTHEHLAILRLLGVDRGVVAVTKADAVDAETLELALEEARELVPGAPVVAVSGVTGAGLDELRAALATVAAETAQRRADFPTRLYVDRVFTLRGIGTVVTGTLWSGAIAEGDRLRLEPAGRDVRVRSVQVHDTPVASAEAGQRVAVSLPGVERRDVRRGDALVAPGAFPRSYRLEVALHELAPIADGARLSVHHGTSRIPARVVRVGDDPRAAPARRARRRRARRPRRAAPRDDRGRGGRPRPGAAAPDGRRARPAARRERPGLDRPRARPRAGQRRGSSRRERCSAARELEEGLDAVRVVDGWAFSDAWLEETAARRSRRGCAPGPRPRRSTRAWCSPSCCPPSRGRRPSSACCRSSGAGRRSSSRGRRRRSARGRTRPRRWSATLASAGLAATKVEDGELARFLEGEGRSSGSATASPSAPGAYEVARDLVVSECAAAGEITLARFRDLAGVGRRDAQLLLERMDVDGVTRRVGDRRVLRRAARADGTPDRRERARIAPTPSEEATMAGKSDFTERGMGGSAEGRDRARGCSSP